MKPENPLWVPLLLSDPSPCLRRLVLKELLQVPDGDAELKELDELCTQDPLVQGLLALQESDGSWTSLGDASTVDTIKATTAALTRMGYLGLSGISAVKRGADYLFSLQRANGAWPMPSTMGDSERYQTYAMIPLQTSIPLRGLAACGYATDERAEKAYEWLLSQRLPDGAWPTGMASGNYGGVAGYRRLAHSRWGCRTNTTEALRCLALHPKRQTSPESRQALDLLLARETRESHTLGIELARTLGAEAVGGWFTYHARFDHALVLDLCWRVAASLEDPRLAALLEFILGLQGSYGLWEYPPRPQITRWLTFDLLRSCARLDIHSDWVSLEPRTPFRAYPKRRRRY